MIIRQAWNTWGEPNHIFFEGNRVISSIIVFFSPYFMPLLFVLAGISTKYALQKRTKKEYLIERVKRLSKKRRRIACFCLVLVSSNHFKCLSFPLVRNKVTAYMNRRSFPFYCWHFIWVVVFQYILYGAVGNRTVVLFAGTVILAYLVTLLCCEISIRIPLWCLLAGTKYSLDK